MTTFLQKHGMNIVIAVLLLIALWALKTRAFVSLPGIGPEKYESLGKIPAQCLTVSLILAATLALAGVRRVTALLTGISLGFLGSTFAAYLQQIGDLKAEAAAASDPDSLEMVNTMLAESHTAPGFWILCLTLSAAALLAVLPFGNRKAAPARNHQE